MDRKLFSAELENLKAKHLLRKFKVFRDTDGYHAVFEGRSYLIFCSNDYLGLSRHPSVIGAIREGAEKFGAGAGASRLVSGSLAPHALLEEKLRDFMDATSVLLFNSGYAANTGIIPAITGRGEVILGDRLNHASVVDGCLLSKAEFRRYPHLDMEALEKLLKKYKKAKARWIVTDGLFSMDGDIAPLPEICGLAEKYDAGIYLDDAHAFGILGSSGRGTPQYFGVEGKIDVHVGTLGKAAGVSGAFVCGSRDLIEFLVNSARTFIYSTAMPPAIAMGAATAVEVLAGFTDERKELLESVSAFHLGLEKLGFITESESYIIPIVTGAAERALLAEQTFWKEGVYIQAIRPPTVPEGSSRLRLTLSLNQSSQDRQKVLDILGDNRSIFIL